MRNGVVIFFLAALSVSGAGKEIIATIGDTIPSRVGSNDSTTATATVDTTVIPAAIRDSFPANSPVAGGKSDRTDITKKTAAQSETDASKRSPTRKISLIKRQYNYRQQIILAMGMMVFVALIMTSAQSWNPK